MCVCPSKHPLANEGRTFQRRQTLCTACVCVCYQEVSGGLGLTLQSTHR